MSSAFGASRGGSLPRLTGVRAPAAHGTHLVDRAARTGADLRDRALHSPVGDLLFPRAAHAAAHRAAGRSMAVGVQPLVRAFWGGALLFAPRPSLRLLGASDIPPVAVTVARILGARHVVQSAVTSAAPRQVVFVTGAAVDALHAATDVLLAATRPQWRRVGVTDAVVTAAFAGSSWWAGRASRRR